MNTKKVPSKYTKIHLQMCQAWLLEVCVENKIAKFSCCLIGQQTPNPKPKTNGLAWIKPYFYPFLYHMEP
jgi:hypothetical protein